MLKIRHIVLHLPAGTEGQAVLAARAMAERVARDYRGGRVRQDLDSKLTVRVAPPTAAALGPALSEGVARRLSRGGLG